MTEAKGLWPPPGREREGVAIGDGGVKAGEDGGLGTCALRAQTPRALWVLI